MTALFPWSTNDGARRLVCIRRRQYVCGKSFEFGMCGRLWWNLVRGWILLKVLARKRCNFFFFLNIPTEPKHSTTIFVIITCLNWNSSLYYTQNITHIKTSYFDRHPQLYLLPSHMSLQRTAYVRTKVILKRFPL